MKTATSRHLTLVSLLLICYVPLVRAHRGSIEAQFHVAVGGRVVLPCRTTLPSSVDWRYRWSPFESPSFIYSNNRTYNNIPKRISVYTSSARGDYNLTIDDALADDTGLYTCIEDGGFGYKHTFSVLVDEAGPPECGPTKPYTCASLKGAVAALTVIAATAIGGGILLVIKLLNEMKRATTCELTMNATSPGSTTNVSGNNNNNININDDGSPAVNDSDGCHHDGESINVDVSGRPDETKGLLAAKDTNLHTEQSDNVPGVPSFRHVLSTPKGKQIRGVCVLGDNLYVARDEQTHIEIFNRQTMTLAETLNVPGDNRPCCMALDPNSDGCIYITYFVNKTIRKVPLDGKYITSWTTKSEPDGIAVMASSRNVIVALRKSDELVEYNSSGEVVTTITLKQGSLPRQVVQFRADKFLVCCGYGKGSVLEVNRKGSFKCVDTKTEHPLDIALHRSGHLLVADHNGGKVVLLDSNLNYVRDAIPKSAGLRRPSRLCFDDKFKTLYIGELSDDCQVLAYNVALT